MDDPCMEEKATVVAVSAGVVSDEVVILLPERVLYCMVEPDRVEKKVCCAERVETERLETERVVVCIEDPMSVL